MALVIDDVAVVASEAVLEKSTEVLAETTEEILSEEFSPDAFIGDGVEPHLHSDVFPPDVFMDGDINSNIVDGPLGDLIKSRTIDFVDSFSESNVLNSVDEVSSDTVEYLESYTFEQQTIDNFVLEEKRPEIEGNMVLGAEHDADTLRHNMSVAMEETPSKEISNAHHIVGNDTPEAAKKLEEYGIDRNDPANGIFLPNSEASPLEGSLHGQGRHIASYSNEVEQRFVNVSSREEALEVLQSLKEDLYSGDLPLHY